MQRGRNQNSIQVKISEELRITISKPERGPIKINIQKDRPVEVQVRIHDHTVSRSGRSQRRSRPVAESFFGCECTEFEDGNSYTCSRCGAAHLFNCIESIYDSIQERNRDIDRNRVHCSTCRLKTSTEEYRNNLAEQRRLINQVNRTREL